MARWFSRVRSGTYILYGLHVRVLGVHTFIKLTLHRFLLDTVTTNSYFLGKVLPCSRKVYPGIMLRQCV